MKHIVCRIALFVYIVVASITNVSAQAESGIDIKAGYNSTFDISKIVMAENAYKNNPELLLQDIVYTLFWAIGIVTSIGLIVSGMFLVFGGADQKMTEKGKTGVKLSLTGLAIVSSSYLIIKAVLAIAAG